MFCRAAQGWSTEPPIITEATARALALCERARHAIERSRELATRTATCQRRLAEAQATLAAARLARRRERAAAAGVPWATPARRLARAFGTHEPVKRPTVRPKTSPAGRPLEVGAASGRVVRRPPRRRGAAARAAGDDGSDGSDGDRPALTPGAGAWAEAPVVRLRVLYDSEGVEWTVRELDATKMPGARNPRCLVFENHQVVRKFWHYPADWGQRDDAALLALSERSM